MEDQVMSLAKLNINAAMLNASATKEDVNKVQAVSKVLTISKDPFCGYYLLIKTI